MKAFGYVRVSSLKQTEGDGFSRQAENIQEYCDHHKLDLLGISTERGISGTKGLEDREALMDLIQHLSSLPQEDRTIVVESADRWGRDLVVGEVLLDDCRKSEISVISASTGTDLTEDGEDGTQAFMRQMLGSFAEYEKNKLVYRMRVARKRKRINTNGKEGVEGVKPYGSLEKEIRTLFRMRSLRKQGSGYGKIADTLNESGTKTRTGKSWTKGGVRKILNNQRSTGLLEEFYETA